MRLVPVLAALLALVAASRAVAGPADGPVVALPTAPAALFVELVVNGQVAGDVASMTQVGDRLLVSRDALRAVGVSVPGTGAVDLATLVGVRATYDAPGQRLLLDVDPALLPTRHITAPLPKAVATSVAPGAVLNYDLYVQTGGGMTSASLWSEQRAFGGFGTVANTGVLHAGGGRTGYVRLDTRYQYVDEHRALEATAGDLITRALPWTTSVRIGGVQLGRNFALRPDLITVPLPSFAGEATVPSGVELFINGYRQSSATVAPGRFVLDAVPVVNGAGEARVVTTDAVGRQIATLMPFYVAPELLRPGLLDFSIEAGALRRGYGQSTFSYGRGVVSGSARYGIARTLTLSGHLEATANMAGAGAGVAWAPARWGAVNGALSASHARGVIGTQVVVGYSFTGTHWSLGAEHVERSDGFTDLGGFDLGRFTGSRQSDRVSVSVPIRGLGSIGAGYVGARLRDGGRVRLASASLSAPIGARASAFAAIDYDADRRAVSAQLRLVVPLGSNTVAGVGLSRQADGASRVQASLARTAPTQGGMGYATDFATDTRGRVLGQATASARFDRVEVDAGVATNGASRSAWASVSGSLALIDGRVFAANALPGAFALVATGMPRVPVYYENQKMGETDAGGRLFVPNVVPYHVSSFTIDPVALPLGAVAERTETRAALRQGTGAVLRMPVAFHRSVTARIVDAAGVDLPAGTVATIAGRAATVGWDGVLVIEGASGSVEITAPLAGGTCRATVTMPADDDLLTDVGTIRCR